jgi:hypothetical protein
MSIFFKAWESGNSPAPLSFMTGCGRTARLRGNAVDADQDFDTFLAKWTEKRIWRVADVLGDVDQQYLAEKRSIELIQLTLEKGFSGELTEIAQRYGSVLHFVKNLFSKADNRPRSPP